ncbi:hypothetical protein [Cellulomonas sp. URHD0024]|uniref:hypothetical protein n=1 Tax=Cellulomonas sp. URHD0024 TaxID=1302620 RepID=UPI000406BE80|nr:hypothetical protein [Cellulomonas sp. URHD0024]
MTRTTAQRVAGWTLVGIATFQAALAAGAPWGEAAYGGGNAGVLPAAERISSVVAVPVYLALAGVAFGRIGSPIVRRRVLRGASVLIGTGALLNLASPSTVERMVWVPVSVVAAISLWRAAPGREALVAQPV